MRISLAAAMLGIVAGTICCAKGPAADPPEPSGPSITSVSPASGPAGIAYPIQITVLGTGFAPSGNVVTFGGIEIPDLDSGDGGTRITFFAPKERPSTGEVPPMVLQPGSYPVTVTTPSGTSAPVAFALTRGP